MPRNVDIYSLILMLLTGLGAQADPQTPQQRADAWLGTIPLPAANYVKNGGFEQGLDGWTYFEHRAGGLDDQVLHTGKATFRMGGRDEDRYVYVHQYNVPLQTGKTYTLSAWVKAKGVSTWGSDSMAAAAIHLTNYGWTNGISLKPPGPTFDWTRLTRTFVAMPTKPRPDGQPTYTLTVFWPPKSDGEFWLDEIQIEEGSEATAFTDVYLGDALAAREKLGAMAIRLFATQSALEKFNQGPLVAQLSGRIEAILAEATRVRDDLRQFNSLPKTAREELSQRVDQLEAQLAGVRTVIWTGPAHIPLSEVQMPAARPETLTIRETCLKGEHRDLALNIANLTTEGYPARVAVSELENEPRAEQIAPGRWISLYSVPSMGGFSKPGQIFTDALPELDQGQIVQINPATISQTILSLDTSELLPGEYTATITITSLVDAAGKTEIPVRLTVLPQAILPLDRIDILECFGHTDYAWEAMIALGVNTFDIGSAWIDSEFDDDGTLKSIDFTRVDREIRRALAEVPDARFLCLSGQSLFSHLEHRCGWKPTEPRFEVAFKAWVKALADHLRGLGVEPSRLIMETYDEPGEGDYVTGTRMANWIHGVDPAIQAQYYVTGIVRTEGWKNNALAHDVVGPAVGACTPDNIAFLKTLGKRLWVYDCAADGESFHPLAYYRLMPWTCRAYGITGWGHFSWFNSSHGFDRGYRPWEGVETQNLVYPGPGDEGFVISRRYLALRAGQEDYQVLDALERVIADPKAAPLQAAQAASFLDDVCARALAVSPRESGYQTHIEKDVAPDLLDELRREAVAKVAAILAGPEELAVALTTEEGKTTLSVTAPAEGSIAVRYLLDGKLPWQVRKQEVAPGPCAIPLADAGEVNRCLVEFISNTGHVEVGLPVSIPRIFVDSTHPSYSPRRLNDGLRFEAVKFEPKAAWISGPAATEHWVQLDFDRPQRVAQVSLFWMTTTGLPQKTMVQYADDAGTWKPVSATPEFRPAAEAVERIEFSPVTTSRLRILMAPNGGGKGGPSLMGLSEVEVR